MTFNPVFRIPQPVLNPFISLLQSQNDEILILLVRDFKVESSAQKRISFVLRINEI